MVVLSYLMISLIYPVLLLSDFWMNSYLLIVNVVISFIFSPILTITLITISQSTREKEKVIIVVKYRMFVSLPVF